METSNKSEYQRNAMRGGGKKKYMKAGTRDKIGIMLPQGEEDGDYYSESTSIEEGLCE
jgi:hypothetical protein